MATSDRSVYHLALTTSMLEGATVALLPGDPGRVEGLARRAPLTAARELANKREYRTWIAYAGSLALAALAWSAHRRRGNARAED